jgi:transposase
MTKRFSLQHKQEMVAYAIAHPERSLKALAAELGVGASTLDKWVRAERLNAGAERKLTVEQERIKQLEKEVAHLREVNEIIKKAHVYFVNNPSR